MLRIILLSFLTFIGGNVFAQITWVYDLKSAQAIALSNDKLIVMDFWAVWCGPCKAMDDKLWSLPEMEQLSENFVALKVDIDSDRLTAQKYRVMSIPKVVIANAAGEIIHESVGFGDAESYLSLLRAIPETVGDLNQALLPLLHNDLSSETHFQIGLEYQKAGRMITDKLLRDSFLDQSDQHLKKVIKKSGDKALASEAELYGILNEAYREKPARAMKKLSKLEDGFQDTKLLELKHFITAYCYKCMGDTQRLSDEKKQISKQAYLEQLDEND